MIKIQIVLALVVASAVSCVPKPKKAYSPAEIGSLESLDELMRINADKADPLFGKRDQTSFTDAELAQMAEAGAAIEATGARTATQFGGKGEFDEGFSDFANKLSAQGKALADAAAAKDAAAAGKALTDIRSTCKGCHGVYR